MSENNEIYKTLFSDAAVGLAVNKMETGEFIIVNTAFADITGYSLEELNQLSFWDLTPKRYEAEEQLQLESMRNTGRYGPYEKHYIKKNGELVAVRLNGSITISPKGEVLTLSAVENISEFEEAKKKIRLSSLALENSSEAVVIMDENKCVISTNPAFSNITGYSFDDVYNSGFDGLLPDQESRDTYLSTLVTLNKEGRWHGELLLNHKNNTTLVLRTSIDAICEEDGTVTRYVALLSDITVTKQWEDMLWNKANFDTLTGLANRNQFQAHLEQQITKTIEHNGKFSLMLIDLDEFKEVNDTLGHDVGDELLTLVGKRIDYNLRRTDFIARFGGDEFVAILPDIERPELTGKIAEKVLNSLSSPFIINNETLHMSASIGIVHCPIDATDGKSLVKHADQAMYVAKRLGKNRFCYFTKSLQDEALKKMKLTGYLREAIEKQQLELYFQPIFDLKNGEICKAEALIRWNHPILGEIPPIEFIPLAETAGLIVDIGSWVAYEAVFWKKRWALEFSENLQISFNVSPIQFKTDNNLFWKEWIESTIQLGKNPNLILEITEGLLLNSEPEILEQFHKLRDAGIEVAIDDFGTGYSSLAYLKEFDIDYLKIDRSFIKNLENNYNDQILSEAIIIMANKLGLKVVAEGVENETQAAFLSQAGCDYGQGYFFSKPVCTEEFELLLSKTKND